MTADSFEELPSFPGNYNHQVLYVQPSQTLSLAIHSFSPMPSFPQKRLLSDDFPAICLPPLSNNSGCIPQSLLAQNFKGTPLSIKYPSHYFQQYPNFSLESYLPVILLKLLQIAQCIVLQGSLQQALFSFQTWIAISNPFHFAQSDK